MCAAPGSKTAQIMEALNPHTAPTTGLLIANDADAKRCHMLVHQTGRMPSIGLGVTCNDACQYKRRANIDPVLTNNAMLAAFPTLKLNESRTRNLTFDRILADVPFVADSLKLCPTANVSFSIYSCSGDGTMRKNPDIWKTWTVANGMQLHGLV
jgi:multisite-specific tRNA:(cytosine-C5)-methyltransferase